MLRPISLIMLLLALLAGSAHAADGDVSWSTQFGGSRSEGGAGVAVGPDGDIYVVGMFNSSDDVDPGPGTTVLVSKGDNDVYVARFHPEGTLAWARGFGGKNYDSGKNVAVDGQGNVFVIGCFKGTIDLDPGDEVVEARATNYGIFLSKFDGDGNLLWGHSIDGGFNDQALDLALDQEGSVLVTGVYSARIDVSSSRAGVDFDPGPGIYRLIPDYGGNAFIWKVDTNGNFVWARSLGGNGEATGNGIVVDASGDILVSGTFSGVNSDFDPGPGEYNFWADGISDAFVCKLTGEGNLVWAVQIGGPNTDQGNGIATDTAGNVYAVGRFEATADFDPGASIAPLTSAGDTDGFLLKLDRDGRYTWAKAMQGSFSEDGIDVAVNCAGEAIVGGQFSGPLTLSGEPSDLPILPDGNMDVFVLGLNGDGTMRWGRGMGGSGHDYLGGLCLADNGFLYVAGTFSDWLNFTPATTAPAPIRAVGGVSNAFLVEIVAQEGAGDVEGTVDGETTHSADRDANGVIDIDELLRVLQLFSFRHYHCDALGEDGFAQGTGETCCAPHDSDFAPKNYQISLNEVLRIIQIYNALGYFRCDEGEDGFCPGMA